MKRKITPYLFAAISALYGLICGSLCFATPFVRFSLLLVGVLFISYFYASLERFGFYDDLADENKELELEQDDETDETPSDENEEEEEDEEHGQE